jgi:uncharacterized protein YecT (DUF1311 family)
MRLIFAIVAICAATPALADYDACISAANGRTAAIYDCIASDLVIRDAQLNTVYRQVLRAQPDQRESFRAAQRLWLAFSKAECKARREAVGGSLGQLVGLECVREMTTERTKALRPYTH